MASRNLQDRIHVGRLAKQMNRDDRLCFRTNRALQQTRIQRVSPLVNINKHRLRAAKTDRLGRGHKGHRRGYHFIPGTDPQREQTQPERVRAVAHPDRIRGTAIGREILLEFCHEGTAGERAAVNDLSDRRHQLSADRIVMGVQVYKGYLHIISGSGASSTLSQGCPPRRCKAARLSSRHCPRR